MQPRPCSPYQGFLKQLGKELAKGLFNVQDLSSFHLFGEDMKLSHLTHISFNCIWLIYPSDGFETTYLLWSLGEFHEAACSFWWFAATATLTTFLVLNLSMMKQIFRTSWDGQNSWMKNIRTSHPHPAYREISDLSFRTRARRWANDLMRHGHRGDSGEIAEVIKRDTMLAVNAGGGILLCW